MKLLTVIFVVVVVPGFVNAQTPQTFNSPDDAVKAIVAAARTKDRVALDRILAPNAKELRSDDSVQESEELSSFVAIADEKTELTKVDDSRYTVELGNDGWSFPVPIVKRGEQWAFDSNEGVNELLLRRVGRNELDTIMVCAAYAVAQWDYFLDGDWNNDGVQEFAQKLVSTSGQKDGLYWASAPGEDPSPFGPLVAYARAEGYRKSSSTSESPGFHGYHMKILKAQGASAAGGAYNYLINGRMIAGFGLVAYPATYGKSGVMTFIVNQQGKVYQKNLGPNTASVAAAMTTYNPDKSWELVDYESALLANP
ncbi:MAG TPA: DUF2950 domain-containing protein [Pyrinomonadaceae bacterium]